MNNILSYCGLVDAKIRASDKDLPVKLILFYANLYGLFCQFVSWTNWVNSGRFMNDCWISCHVMVDMKNFYDVLTIINL